MNRDIGEDRGIVLPIVLSVLLIAMMLTAAVATYSIRSVQRSSFDRDSARALAAADAGLDVATYRINKVVAGGQAVGGIGLVNGTLNQLECLEVSAVAVGLQVGVEPGAEWCDTGGWVAVDDGGAPPGSGPECGNWDGSAFRNYLRHGVDAEVTVGGEGLINDDPLTWQVLSVGCSNGRAAVVRGVLGSSLTAALAPSRLVTLFALEDFTHCASLDFDAADPAAGCPE